MHSINELLDSLKRNRLNFRASYWLATVFFCLLFSFGGNAQTNLRAWHAHGQTWLVWENTAPSPETYRIYKSSASITNISSAELIGRIFEGEWAGNRLKQLDSTLNWIIPNQVGGSYTLTDNEALFVYTPHEAIPEYFVVMKDGESAIGSHNLVGPIDHVIEPVQCHLQASGNELDYDYEVYSHWIDGRNNWYLDREDYPVMGNNHFNGVPFLFRIWKPVGTKPTDLLPGIVGLHAGGGWYGQMKPSPYSQLGLSEANAFFISPCDHVLVKKPGGIYYQKTYWLGYWKNYNRFQLSGTIPDIAIIVDYTLRRIDWELSWLLDHYNIDSTRLSLIGCSMGARGANYLARYKPERFASWISFSPGTIPASNDPFVGLVSQNLKTNLPGSPGVIDVMGLQASLSDLSRDIPYGKFVIGRSDGGDASGWRPDLLNIMGNLDDKGLGSHLYWDERGHCFSGGSYWNGSPQIRAASLLAYQSNQSFPAFFNVDMDLISPGRQPNIGNGDPSDGDTWGTWSGYCSWDPESVSDTPSRWESDVYLRSSGEFPKDIPAFDSCVTDVAIRKPQNYIPAEGTNVNWTLTRNSDGRILQTGSETVGQNNLVTIPGLIIYKDKCKLSISHNLSSIPLINSEIEGYYISQNYPNPVSSTTTIQYRLAHSERIFTGLYNSSGRLIKTLVNEKKPAGDHTITWDAKDMKPGVYFYKIETPNYSCTKKCLVID